MDAGQPADTVGGISDPLPPHTHTHTQEACNLLEKHDVVLAMAGDSLVRHVTQALLTVMTGDFQRGGHMWWDQSKELQGVC